MIKLKNIIIIIIILVVAYDVHNVMSQETVINIQFHTYHHVQAIVRDICYMTRLSVNEWIIWRNRSDDKTKILMDSTWKY